MRRRESEEGGLYGWLRNCSDGADAEARRGIVGVWGVLMRLLLRRRGVVNECERGKCWVLVMFEGLLEDEMLGMMLVVEVRSA